jgi:hypothetical protein
MLANISPPFLFSFISFFLFSSFLFYPFLSSSLPPPSFLYSYFFSFSYISFFLLLLLLLLLLSFLIGTPPYSSLSPPYPYYSCKNKMLKYSACHGSEIRRSRVQFSGRVMSNNS